MRSCLISLLLCLTFFVPAMADPVFTGNASADFLIPGTNELLPGTDVLIDPGGKDVGLPNPPFNENDTSGWDIKDCYYHYNRSSDTMYVGLDFYGIAGDADGDGDPSHTSDRLASKFGLDWPNLTMEEAICTSYDTNNDGKYDVVVGMSGFAAQSIFGTYNFVGATNAPALAFGTKFNPDPAVLYAMPNSTCPDWEFYITNFSKLPGFIFNPGESFDFSKKGFAGSLADDGIGEDILGSHVYFDFYDFADAPASYKTLLKDNGPVHKIVHDLHLGNSITDEPDGQPSDHADVDKGDDGVSFSAIYTGNLSNIIVNASAPGKLNAWMDFNGDGNWSEPDEQIFVDKGLVEGNNALTFNVPSGAKPGNTFARFRFSTTGELSSCGLAANGSVPDGEVEDYLVLIEKSATLGDRAWMDGNRNGIQDPGEGGLPGVAVELFKSDHSLVGTNITNAKGNYLFPYLVPGDYYLVFHAQYYTFSPKDRGSDDAVDSDADVVSGKTGIIHLIAGREDLSWDAGLFVNASINATKIAFPDSGVPSTNIEFTIKVTNTGNVTLNPVEANDTLPGGLSYISDNQSGKVSGKVVTWSNLGTLEPGESRCISLVAHVDGGIFGRLTNQVNVIGKPPVEGNVTNNTTENVTAFKPGIEVIKTADPTFGSPSSNFNFTLLVKNSGNASLPHVFVSDLLPTGMSYVSSSSGSTQSGQTVSWSDIGPLGSGDRKLLWIVAHIDGPVSGVQTLTNRVEVQGKPEHGQNVTNSSTADVRVQEAAISVTKTADPTFGSPSTNVTFTLFVKNSGSSSLPHVFVSDLLPNGMSYVSSSVGSTHSGQTVSWSDIGPLGPGASKVLWIVAHIDGPVSGIRTLTNRVDVEGKPEHGQNVTNGSTADVKAEGANIMVRKTAYPTFGSPSTNVNFTLVVNNTGSTLLPHVFVTDLLPAGMSYVSSSSGSTQSGQTVSWSDIGPLISGDSKVLWIVAHIDGLVSGIRTLTNRVDVEGKPEHGQNVTNSSTADVKAEGANIMVQKTADPTFGSPSTNVNFTLVVNNTGSTPLPHVFVSDLLPTGMSYVSSSSGSTNTGQTVNWSDIGPLGSGDSKQLWIVAHIDGPVSGIRTLTNRVDVQGKPEHGNNVTNSTTVNVTAFMPNIEVTKNAISYAELPPTDITYIIMIINSGDILLDPVWANDTLVAGLGYVSDNRSGIVSGNSIAWNNLGSLAPGECTYISMVTHADRGVWGVENQVDVTGKPPIGNNVTNSTTTGYNWQPPVIYGQKFNDLNGNGTNDDYTDPGLQGWTIELVNESGEVVNSNTTDEYGNYWIGPLSRGNYTVREVQQPGWQQTCPAQGSYSINTDDSDLTGIDFGNRWISEINVTKVAYPTSASPGANITFDIEIVNKGETTLSHVNAVDTLPAGMTYVSDNNRNRSVSESTIFWNDLGDLAPGASKGIELVGRIDRNISGVLINVVDVTAKDPGGNDLTDSAIAEVRSLLPKIKVNKTLEPVQYGQYCEAKTISGVGIIESRTSIEDKTMALEYDDTLAGEGEIELESAAAMSEAAEKLQRDVPSLDPENQSSLNLFADTKLAFKGSKPLTGGKSIHSMAFYGGSGARIKDIFSAEEMEKEQTIYFSSTDKASSPQTIGTDLKSRFNGTIETDSKMHNTFSQDINSRQLFSGVFNLDKVIKFHKNVTTDEPKMGCDVIDC